MTTRARVSSQHCDGGGRGGRSRRTPRGECAAEDGAQRPPTLDAKPVAKEALARGLHLFVRGNVVLVAPPLVISREDLAEGLALLDEVLDR